MLEALLWGFAAASSLLVGAALGLRLPLGRRPVALLMGFGAGTLISAVSFELAAEALATGGALALGLGLAGGALAFYAGDRAIEGMGGQERPQRPRGADTETTGLPLVLGALLDGLPESAAIGLSLAAGAEGGVGIALVAAVLFSNVPESLASAVAMRRAGRSARLVLGLWLAVVALSTAAAGIGFAVLGDASGTVTGTVQAVAAGAILVMLVDSMVPEAAREGGPTVGLVTVMGFAVAVLLSQA